MQQITEASLIYYARRQCAEQWRVFLTVLAEEFSAQMQPDERRQLMHSLGRRMADKLLYPDVATLAELEAVANALWEQLEWGYVVIQEEQEYVALTHHCSPLRAAFGAAAIKWSPALLEGVYARWFETFGAGDDLQLLQVTRARGSDDAIEFRLARSDILEQVLS